MAVNGDYIAWRIRRAALPFITVYGQWVDLHVVPLFAQLSKQAEDVQNAAYERLGSQSVSEDYCGDGSEIAERAFDEGLSFYETLVCFT